MLVISGKSCSGKDSISAELEKLGYVRIPTFTTRPIRPNEIGNDKYNRLSVEEFLKRYMDGFFLEARYYKTEFGLWFYGSSKESYKNADNNTIAILTPSGIEALYGEDINFKSVYIDVSDDIIKQRQIKRGDNQEEANRRFNEDVKDFINIKEITDYEIDNNNRNIKDVAEEIIKLYKGGTNE